MIRILLPCMMLSLTHQATVCMWHTHDKKTDEEVQQAKEILNTLVSTRVHPSVLYILCAIYLCKQESF